MTQGARALYNGFMKIALLLLTMMAVIFIGLFTLEPVSPLADAEAEMFAKQAYQTARAYFLECGGTRLDRMALLTLGLDAPSDISLEIENGSPDYLSINVHHTHGGFIHKVDARGNIRTLPRGRLARLISRFTYPKESEPPRLYGPHVAPRFPDPGSAARMAVRNAYSAAQYFFVSNPDGTLTRDDLGAWCGRRDDGITVDILDGRMPYLRLRARHPESGAVWEVDSDGRITSPAQKAEASLVTPNRPLKPSRITTPEAADREARETAARVFELSRSYLAEYRPASGLKLDALKRAHPEYSISPDVTVEVVDRRAETLRLKVSHRLGSKVFEVDSEGQVTARSLN